MGFWMLRWAFANAGVDGSSHGIRFKTKSKVKAVGHTGLFASGYHAETLRRLVANSLRKDNGDTGLMGG